MRFIESPVFTASLRRHLDDEQYRALQAALSLRPEQGALIPGGAGLRKVRWGAEGRGKRGGVRTIYYWAVDDDVCYMGVSVREERARRLVAHTDPRAGARGTRGVQVKAEAFEELLTSVRQLGAIRRGERKPARSTTFKPTDVKAVRADLGQSQAEFAMMIGVSVATLRNWEQGRRTPDGPALALLQVAAHNPAAVVEALHRPRRRGAA